MTNGGTEHGGVLSSGPDPDPSAWVGVGGVAIQKIFSLGLGALLSSLFHSEHFECTQVVGYNLRLPFTTNENSPALQQTHQ